MLTDSTTPTQRKRGIISISLALTLSVLALSCSQKPKENLPKETRVSVLTFNVENLFDTEHDEGKGDFEYLPIERKQSSDVIEFCQGQPERFQNSCFEKNWSEEVLKTKMHRIADTLLQVEQGSLKGPDIVVLTEVENIKILRRLVSEYLPNQGYQTVVLLEGDDERGIDIGLISRFPLAAPAQLHRIRFSEEVQKLSGEIKTRGILEVPLLLPNGKVLYTFGLHLPSQANPTQERRDGVNTLNDLLKELPGGSYAMAAGDFNITASEDLEHGYFSKVLSHYWDVSHLVGCSQCDGTYYYRGSWSFLDAILFSKNMNGKHSIGYLPESIRVLKGGNYQVGPKGWPYRFDSQKPKGVSDHLPVYSELKLKN